MVLALGNAMNAGTAHGGAAGFQMETLLQLSSVKSTDGQQTLMDFVVLSVNQKEHLGEFWNELVPVSEARGVSISEVSKGVQGLKKGSELIKRRLGKEVQYPEDKFPALLKDFIQKAEGSVLFCF